MNDALLENNPLAVHKKNPMSYFIIIIIIYKYSLIFP